MAALRQAVDSAGESGVPAEAFITISVDDGHPTDLRTAKMLADLNLQATFYIPARNRERPVLPAAEVRRLAQRFEVGAHTLNHVSLPSLPLDRARAEVRDGKAWLEDVTGQRVRAFCYPRGKFNAATVRLVEQAGYSGARSCLLNHVAPPTNPFLWGVTTQGHSHSVAIQVRHALLEGNIVGLRNFFTIQRATRDWEEHFLRSAATIAKIGGVAHLYLHSWEIEKQGDWAKLRRVLARAREHRDLTTVTNGFLFEKFRRLHVSV